MRAVASALCKLMDAKPTQFNDAFDQLGERMLLCFTKGDSQESTLVPYESFRRATKVGRVCQSDEVPVCH
jgi:hypothetical protein